MRTMHFVRFFQSRGEVDLMCYKSHAPEHRMETPFRREYYIELHSGGENDIGLLQVFRDRLVECKPWIVQSFTDATVRYIHRIIMEEDYDVILCRYSINAYPLLSLADPYRERVILDIDDIMYGELYDAIYGEKKGVVKTKAMLDKIIFQRYQMRCMELGKVLFCSENDRAKMGRCGGGKKFVVPNIAPKQTIPSTYKRDGFGSDYLLFVGVLSYRPNEKGIVWFINEIFDKLPSEFSHLKLLVVGRNPQPGLKEICARHPKIELVDSPPDVLPYFEKCSIVVVPVLVGGGTRIKILEAGHCCRPVVSTRLGSYGLEVQHRKEVVFFDDCKSFVESLAWLKERENYAAVVQQMKDVVERSYTEASFNSSLNALLSS